MSPPPHTRCLVPRQCRVLPCPARSRSKGVPTAPISASMPRLPRQKPTLSKDLYPSPPEHPTRYLKTPSQALRRHPRSSHGVWATYPCMPMGVFGDPQSFATIMRRLPPFLTGPARAYSLAASSSSRSQSITSWRERPFLALIPWLLACGDGGSEDTNPSSSRAPSMLAMEGLVASDQVVLRGP
jgi:hypothetical protein